jgi:hypothetical protein
MTVNASARIENIQDVMNFADVTPDLIYRTIQLLTQIPINIPEPQIRLSVDDDIAIMWHNNKNKIELCVDEDFYAVWFGFFDGKYEDGYEFILPSALPPLFFEMLERLYEIPKGQIKCLQA